MNSDHPSSDLGDRDQSDLTVGHLELRDRRPGRPSIHVPLKTACFILGAALLLLAACSTGGDRRDRREARRLVGAWNCVSAVVDGKYLPDQTVHQLRLTLTESHYKTERSDEVLFDSSYTINSSTHPKQINMVGTEGNLAGKQALGIYLIEGDTLRICYTMPGKPRPAGFESLVGSGAFLMEWKR